MEAVQRLLTTKYERPFEEDPVELQEDQLRSNVFDKHWAEVVRDNHLLLQENVYLSEEISAFVVELISQLPRPYLAEDKYVLEEELPAEVASLYEISYRYLTYMVFEMGAKLEVDCRLVAELQKMLRYIPRKCELLLERHLNIFYLINCTKEFRIQIKFLYTYVLCVCCYVAGLQLTPAIEAFLEGLLKELNGEVAKNWSKSYEYFDFIKDLMQHQTFRGYLLDKDIVGMLLDFMMDKDSPVQLQNPTERKYQIGNSIQP